MSRVRGRSAAPPGTVESRTEVEGRSVRSLSVGILGSLPEVVLLPGLGAPDYLFPWMRETATWTRATVLDLPGWRRGRGRSSASTVGDVGRVAAGWLTATGRSGVVVVGHSSGAHSALRTARLVPERLVGLVLAGPTLDPPARQLPRLLLRSLVTIANERPSELCAVLPWYVRSGGLPWLRLVRSVVRDRPEDLVQGLTVPVQTMTGERDRFAPPDWSAHLAALARGDHAQLPGAHNACFTHPEATDQVLRAAVAGWVATHR